MAIVVLTASAAFADSAGLCPKISGTFSCIDSRNGSTTSRRFDSDDRSPVRGLSIDEESFAFDGFLHEIDAIPAFRGFAATSSTRYIGACAEGGYRLYFVQTLTDVSGNPLGTQRITMLVSKVDSRSVQVQTDGVYSKTNDSPSQFSFVISCRAAADEAP